MKTENFYIISIDAVPSNQSIKNNLFENFDEFTNLILPKPNGIKNLKGSVALKLPFQLSISNIDPNDYILHDLKEQISSIFDESENMVLKITEDAAKNISDDYPNTLMEHIEGYLIKCEKESVCLVARSRQGLFYACQTFVQMLNLTYFKEDEVKNCVMPGIKIIDYPCFPLRGIADDITRGQVPTVESLKSYIHKISHFKMNAYAIGYEQDFYDFENYPINFDYKANLTAAEIDEVQRYAEKRFVDLFPIYTSFGHQDNLLQKKEYSHLGEFPGSQCFNIADKRIYDILDAHYRELADVFKSKSFHMGCDESFDLGVYRSQQYLDEVGRGKALLKHYKRIYNLAKKLGKDDIYIYHDIVTHFEDELKDTPKDLRIMYWEYSPKRKYPKVGKLVNYGFPIVISPSHLNWCRHFPDYINAAENTINLIETAKEVNRKKPEDVPGVVGQLNSTWGDFTNHNLRENNIYGSVLSGAASWSNEKINAEDFLLPFIAQYYHIRKLGPLESLARCIWDCAHLIQFYKGIGVMMPQPFYMHLYRHPFYSLKPRKYIKKFDAMVETANLLLKDLETIVPFVNNNQEILQYLEISIKLARLIGLKERLIQRSAKNLKKLAKMNRENNEDKTKKIDLTERTVEIIKNFNQELSNVSEFYEKCWINCAKRPVLDYHLGRYKNLYKYCEAKIKNIEDGVYDENPFLPSEWIEVNTPITPPIGVFFRKSFDLHENPGKNDAKLLVMAGDHAIVYINGVKIGEVHSRMSLSFVPIKERIQLFDVGSQLTLGSNTIVVESYNYISGRNSLNALLRIQYTSSDGENEKFMEIRTDSSWDFTTGYNAKNPDLDLKNPDEKLPIIKNIEDLHSNNSSGIKLCWDPVKSLGKPPVLNGHIYNEDILTGKIPYTEAYFGFESYTYGIFYNMIHPIVAKIANRVFGFIKKLLKIK